jgi:hypothetical protein
MSYLPPVLQRWFKAIDSANRSWLKQYRRMRSMQRTAARFGDDPFAS